MYKFHLKMVATLSQTHNWLIRVTLFIRISHVCMSSMFRVSDYSHVWGSKHVCSGLDKTNHILE